MRKNIKYTPEVLSPLVKSSFSIAEVLRKLGLRCINGGTHAHVTKKIKVFGLDTSHFLGQMRSIGKNAVHEKLPWTEFLVLNRHGRKEDTSRLRRAMIESGIPHICGTCESLPVWKDKPLVLQISHRNGDSIDNRKENLHFECPNCHSQTDDFGGKGAGKLTFRASLAQQTEQLVSTEKVSGANPERGSNLCSVGPIDKTAVYETANQSASL